MKSQSKKYQTVHPFVDPYLNKKIDPEYEMDQGREGPLHLAVKCGDEQQVLQLLDIGES